MVVKQYNFGDLFTNDEVLEATGGTKSTYTGKWQVIGVENGKLKLVSESNVCDVTLGYGDPTVTGSSNYEKAINSWKKSVTTLNNAAKTNTGISGTRSLSIEDIEKLIDINQIDDYGSVFSYGEERTFSKGTFVDKHGNTVEATKTNKVTIKNNAREASNR